MFDDRTFHDPCGTRSAIASLFYPEAVLAATVRLEVALAEVQSDMGLIPASAAAAINQGAASWVPDREAVARHQARVGHPMVAILDAFSEAIAPEGQEWLHFGITTADVFRTVSVMLLQNTVALMDRAMARIETRLAELATEHRTTPMIGRTLGRHALPISFGYKVCIWLSEVRRDRDRLQAWSAHFRSGVLSGAVGTHAALGRLGPEVERRVMARLGLGAPDPVDTKGAQDIFAEFAATLAIAARGCQRIAQEIFLLQGDDIRELSFVRQAVGSSTMPHKVNPSLCVEIMSRATEVSAMLPVFLEWIVIIHERDSAIHYPGLEQLCTDMGQILSCTEGMLEQLIVHPEAMLNNIERTRGAVLTESVTVQLADRIGRRTAHERMQAAVARMNSDGLSLAEALALEPDFAGLVLPEAAELIGEAPALVDACLTRLGFAPPPTV